MDIFVGVDAIFQREKQGNKGKIQGKFQTSESFLNLKYTTRLTFSAFQEGSPATQ
jgi:hypothetical protein